jgi:glycerol-3-phosphate dehydrogenase
VIYSYSGVRPLPYEEQGREGAITRRHFIVDHANDGLPGLYSLVGGKLTTFRTVGRRVTQMMKRRLGERWPTKPEAGPVEGAAPTNFQSQWGGRAYEVYQRLGEQPHLSSPLCAHSPEPRAALVEAACMELAATLGDVLLRRTTIGWRSCQGLHVVEDAAKLVGQELGWDEVRRTAEIERYRDELLRVHPVPGKTQPPASELAIQSAALED